MSADNGHDDVFGPTWANAIYLQLPVDLPGVLREHLELDASEILCAVALFGLWHEAGETRRRISGRKLAARAGLGHHQARDAVKGLVEKGLLVILKRGSKDDPAEYDLEPMVVKLDEHPPKHTYGEPTKAAGEQKHPAVEPTSGSRKKPSRKIKPPPRQDEKVATIATEESARDSTLRSVAPPPASSPQDGLEKEPRPDLIDMVVELGVSVGEVKGLKKEDIIPEVRLRQRTLAALAGSGPGLQDAVKEWGGDPVKMGNADPAKMTAWLEGRMKTKEVYTWSRH
jgi:hypothetical protein